MAEGDWSTALGTAARSLRASARDHKRAEAFHRKQARAAMQRLSDLQIFCEAHGIKFEIQEAERKESHGPHR